MTDHDHAGEVERLGECITCAAAPPAPAPTTRGEALAAVYHGAPDEWLRRAQAVVRDLAAAGAEFTTDDVWKRLPPPPEPRAIGAVVLWAAQAGLIANSHRTKPSHRAECHGRPVTVWLPTTTRLL